MYLFVVFFFLQRTLRHPLIPCVENFEMQFGSNIMQQPVFMSQEDPPHAAATLVRKREKPHPNIANQWNSIVKK